RHGRDPLRHWGGFRCLVDERGVPVSKVRSSHSTAVQGAQDPVRLPPMTDRPPTEQVSNEVVVEADNARSTIQPLQAAAMKRIVIADLVDDSIAALELLANDVLIVPCNHAGAGRTRWGLEPFLVLRANDDDFVARFNESRCKELRDTGNRGCRPHRREDRDPHDRSLSTT